MPDHDCLVRISSCQVFLYISFGIGSPVFIASCKRQGQQAGCAGSRFFPIGSANLYKEKHQHRKSDKNQDRQIRMIFLHPECQPQGDHDNTYEKNQDYIFLSFNRVHLIPVSFLYFTTKSSIFPDILYRGRNMLVSVDYQGSQAFP